MAERGDRRELWVLGFNYTLVDINKSRSFGILTRDRPAVQEAVKLKLGLPVHLVNDSGSILATERLSTTTRVRLQWPGGDTVVCDQDGMGDNPWADEVVAELQKS